MAFVLDGKKLRGGFDLVKLRDQQHQWLLIKKRDRYATTTDILANDRSAVSGRKMEEIAATTVSRPRANSSTRRRRARLDLSGAPKAPMPRNVRPMLATAVDKPFDNADWLFEIKWDGYRAIAEVNGDDIRLYSRNQLSLAQKFPPIVEALRDLGHEAVLDAEVTVLDERGRSQFSLLQRYSSAEKRPLVYYVFDLLYLDGYDLRKLPLTRRKELLQAILPQNSTIQFSEHLPEHGVAFFASASAQDLEGIVAKQADSVYRAGTRVKTWLKIKTHRRQEAVIGGFTMPRGERVGLGPLVLGVYEDGKLVYVGHVGTGFDDVELRRLHDLLKPLVQSKCPFPKRPPTNAPAQWVRPELVCEVSFQEWTPDGCMRQPVYQGLRFDKPAPSVAQERLVSTASTGNKSAESRREVKSSVRPARPMSGATASPVTVPLTNLNKVYWPDEGYTKGDLITYYRETSSVVLPYLKDRPLSLLRHPNGIRGESFFQKDVSRQPPPAWVQTERITSGDGAGRVINYFVCQNEKTLLYLANLGCIELNPWSSRLGSLDRPDYLLMDLDPEAVHFDDVVTVAQEVHRLLDKAGAASYCKTSGKRGLHIYVPLGARYDYTRCKQLAELIARLVFQRLPRITSLIRMPAQRQQRVYLDYLQNGRAKTLAAAYSVRPWPGATVSAPLKWSELRRGLDPSKFTIKTMPRRLARLGDYWAGVSKGAIDLVSCVDRLQTFMPLIQK